MVVNLQEYKKNRQKDIKRIITDEENFEILLEMDILRTIQKRKESSSYCLKLVK